eukprot:scaffold649_cov347-Pavlova_lutheri.AAC.9
MSAVKRLLRARSVKSLFIFEADVLGVYNVLPGTSRLSVTWKRGSKAASTKVADVKGGEALWNEKLQLHATLFQDPRNSQFDDKECTFIVRENSKTAMEEDVYGKVTFNLADVVQDGKPKEVRYPLVHGSKSLPTHLHVVLRASKTNVMVDPLRARNGENGLHNGDADSDSDPNDHVPPARRKLFGDNGVSVQDDLSEQLRATEEEGATEFIDAEEDFIFQANDFDDDDVKARKEQIQTDLVGLKAEVSVLHRNILDLKREKEAAKEVKDTLGTELELARRRATELEEQKSQVESVAEERAVYIDHLEHVLQGMREHFEGELSTVHKEMEMSCREVASLADAYVSLENYLRQLDPLYPTKVHESLVMRLSASTLEQITSRQSSLASLQPEGGDPAPGARADNSDVRMQIVIGGEGCKREMDELRETVRQSWDRSVDLEKEVEHWKSDYTSMVSTADDLRTQLIKTKLQLAEMNFERDLSKLERRESPAPAVSKENHPLNNFGASSLRRWSHLLGKP